MKYSPVKIWCLIIWSFQYSMQHASFLSSLSQNFTQTLLFMNLLIYSLIYSSYGFWLLYCFLGTNYVQMISLSLALSHTVPFIPGSVISLSVPLLLSFRSKLCMMKINDYKSKFPFMLIGNLYKQKIYWRCLLAKGCIWHSLQLTSWQYKWQFFREL